jgi:hypothetical protein
VIRARTRSRRSFPDFRDAPPDLAKSIGSLSYLAPATGIPKEAYGISKWLVIPRSIEQDSKIGCQRLCEIVDRAVFDERH